MSATQNCRTTPTVGFGEFGERPQLPILDPMDPTTTFDWREGLPTLVTPLGTVREVVMADAPSLCEHLNDERVARFIPPPPASTKGFEDFVDWAHLRRAQGRYACFGIVPAGQTAAVGVFQVHVPSIGSPVADWGFAMGVNYWGSGIFAASAERIRQFVFARMGVDRLEARSAVPNGRGNGALQKVGASPAGVLTGSERPAGDRFDMALWIITDAGPMAPRLVRSPRVR